MEQKPQAPFIPPSSNVPELTVKAVLLGVLMAVILGAANAYLGMKAGLTVAATFPAAVVAMAALRTTFRVLVPALPQPVTVPASARPVTEPA